MVKFGYDWAFNMYGEGEVCPTGGPSDPSTRPTSSPSCPGTIRKRFGASGATQRVPSGRYRETVFSRPGSKTMGNQVSTLRISVTLEFLELPASDLFRKKQQS